MDGICSLHIVNDTSVQNFNGHKMRATTAEWANTGTLYYKKPQRKMGCKSTCGMDPSASEERLQVGCCEHGNGHSGSVK
jgi:hypothetical protein